MALIAIGVGLILGAIFQDLGLVIAGIGIAVVMIWLETKWLHQHIHETFDNGEDQ